MLPRTNDGKRFIAQPYQNVSVPWYAVAYDMLYGAFTVIQIAMALDMATFTLNQEPNGPAFLQENLGKLIESVWDLANKLGDAIAPDSSAGEAIEPINVDVNIDTDVDTDVDIDIDIDVDVDVDIDVGRWARSATQTRRRRSPGSRPSTCRRARPPPPMRRC